MDLEALRQLFRDNPRTWWIVGLGVVVALIVVWGVYGGFSLQFSRFFAGQEPLPTPIPGNCGPSVPAGGDFNWGYTTNDSWPTCSGTNGVVPGTDYWVKTSVGTCHPNGLHLVWRAEHRDVATCDTGLAGGALAEGAGITTEVTNFSNMDLPDGVGGTATMHYIPSTFTCGSVRLWGAFWASGEGNSPAKNAGYTGYYQVLNYGTDCSAATPTPAGTPTPPPTATPGPPVFCSPQTQTVTVGQVAQLQATGGTGVFNWDIGSGALVSGGNQTIGISYAVAGSKSVRVSSGGQSATCSVVVSGASPTPTGGLGLTKQGANISAGQTTPSATVADVSPGQTVRFTTTVANASGQAVTDLILRDQVPIGMSYEFGSTIVQGQSVSSDALTSGDGLWLGRLENNDSVVVEWRALADQTVQLSPGRQMVQAGANVTTDQGLTASAVLQIPIIGGSVPPTGGPSGPGGGGGGGGVGGVQTGPGDVVVMALGVAAIAALLYAGYTRSPAFRRKEIEHLARMRDTQDFRN